MTDNQHLDDARKRAGAKVEFYMRLALCVVVIGMLLGINLITWSGYYWVIWPAFFWCVALAFHAANAFLIAQTGTLIDRIAKRELEKSTGRDPG